MPAFSLPTNRDRLNASDRRQMGSAGGLDTSGAGWKATTVSIRRIHPGPDTIDVQVNGRVLGSAHRPEGLDLVDEVVVRGPPRP